ncbi:unnamed protein product, partial [Rotaria socialis]
MSSIGNLQLTSLVASANATSSGRMPVDRRVHLIFLFN